MTDNSIMIFIMAHMTFVAHKIQQPQRRFQMSLGNLNLNDNFCFKIEWLEKRKISRSIFVSKDTLYNLIHIIHMLNVGVFFDNYVAANRPLKD